MWLMPAAQYETSSKGTPMYSARAIAVPCTEWHRPDVADVGQRSDRPGEHDHRIGIVEHQGVGADLLHGLRDLDHGRRVPQKVKDAARARVSPMAWSMPYWSGISTLLRIVADADGDGDIVGPIQRFAQVGGRLDLRAGALLGDHAPRQGGHRLQLVRVDVHQGDGRVLQRRPGEKVGHQPAGEHKASGAD